VLLEGVSYSLAQTVLLQDVSFSHRQTETQHHANSRSYCSTIR